MAATVVGRDLLSLGGSALRRIATPAAAQL